jgi:cellobiose epimerase
MTRGLLGAGRAWLRLVPDLALARGGSDEAAPARDELARQAQRCRHILKTSIVDFYLPACVDHDHGGYLEWLRDGKFVATGEKFLTMQARQLWFFSTLARHGIEKGAALAAAGGGFRFLEDKMRDRKHGGYFSKVSDDGRPADRRKHVYLNVFALYGLTAFHRTTGDAGALDAAKALFCTLEVRAHDRKNGGYDEFFWEDWSPIVDRRQKSYVGAVGVKTYNTHLHAMEAQTELYLAWPDPSVRDRLTELLIVNTCTVGHTQFACNIGDWHPAWRMAAARKPQASYGHDLECVWVALRAARTLGLSPRLLLNWAEALCEHSLRFGHDRKHGGFFYTGYPGRHADDTRKEWWVQAEALVSMLEMYRLTNSPRYYAAFRRTLDFIEVHQVAREGGWWSTRTAAGAPQGTQRSSMWQGAYHSGRAMIRCANLLDELARAR